MSVTSQVVSSCDTCNLASYTMNGYECGHPEGRHAENSDYPYCNMQDSNVPEWCALRNEPHIHVTLWETKR